MTLEEAIKILTIKNRDFNHTAASDLHNAIKLGIEALKAYAQARRLGLPLRCDGLPGETEE